MALTSPIGTQEIDPAALADIEKFERLLAQYLAGEIDDDVFRVFRLNNGIYGQRQGGHNQMVRVKVPYGARRARPAGDAGPHRRDLQPGLGPHHHPPEHPVPLRAAREDPRGHAPPGLGGPHHARGLRRHRAQRHACHLAGACPFEVLDISPWAEAAYRHFLRHPYAQRLPRKFKINFSGCATDCGQAMFNDVGVIAVNRPLEDGTVEPGFRVFIAGGLGANPHPAQALEDFTAKEDLLPTIEAVLRTFDHYGNRDNKLRARLKWLVDTMGIDELRERILKERKFLMASTTWPGGIPEIVQELGDAPAGVNTAITPTPVGQDTGTLVKLTRLGAYNRWEDGQRGAGRGQGHRLGLRLRPPGRHHHRPVPGPGRHPARLRPRGAGHQPPERRVPRPHRGAAARRCSPASTPSAWPSPAPSWPATSWPARAPTPATWPSPRAGAWPTTSARRSTRPGWPTWAASASTSRAAPTAAASTTSPTSASWASSAGPTASPPPATRCCSAATWARPRSSSATRRCACRPRTAPRPPCGWSAASPPSATPARRSPRGSSVSAAPRCSAPSSRTSTSSPRPRRTPTSTSTSARPALHRRGRRRRVRRH